MRYMIITVVLMLFHPKALNAAELSFIGLHEDNWQIYTKNLENPKSQPKVLAKDIVNPRAFSRFPKSFLIAYIDESGMLFLRDLKSKKSTPLQETGDKSRYTQLRFDNSGTLWGVKLPEGNSRQTYLVSFDVKRGTSRISVAKRGAQFDPFFSEPYLYYSSAHCVDDCDPMIWEIWRRDLNTATQRQLTLGDAVSREPVPLAGSLYFTSNRDHFYHIWRMKPERGAAAEQITSGSVTDTNLSPIGDSELFFIRRLPDDVSIMRYDVSSNKTIKMEMPDWIDDMRELEVYE